MSRMLEDPNQFVCALNHDSPVFMVLFEKNVDKSKRLLCIKCMDQVDTIQNKIIEFKQSIKLIEENQIKKNKLFDIIISKNIREIQQFKNNIHSIKDIINQQIDLLLDYSLNWIESITQIKNQSKIYSYFDEIEILLQNQYESKYNVKLLNEQLKNVNQSYGLKLKNTCSLLKQFQKSKEFQEIELVIESLQNTIVNQEANIQKKQDLCQNNKNDIIQQRLKQSEMRIKFISSVQQVATCYCISFNWNDTLMANSNNQLIEIWQFQDGKIKQLDQKIEFNRKICCMSFSKIKNFLIIALEDGSIQISKENQKKQQECISFEQKHHNHINCIILNRAENQLFTGSNDKLIIIWKIDPQNQNVIYQQSLKKHSEGVIDISLNPSETILASAGSDKQLIIFKLGQNKEWIFNYIVNQYVQQIFTRLCFIKDDQLISVSTKNYFNVYEIENDQFQENYNKSIPLDQAPKIDFNLFPICYNKEQNIIVVKNKTIIFILREIENGCFKIFEQIQCESNRIFGSLSRDGKFLVYWDESNKLLNLYELQQV